MDLVNFFVFTTAVVLFAQPGHAETVYQISKEETPYNVVVKQMEFDVFPLPQFATDIGVKAFRVQFQQKKKKNGPLSLLKPIGPMQILAPGQFDQLR